jgi:hypothetical protein
VLLKIITLVDSNIYQDKLQLIDEISNATNKQTPVINADKFANEILHQQIQRKIFDRYGLLYERKRGEFSDGIRSGYIDSDIIIERNLFLRIFYSANGMINKGSEKKLFQKNQFPELNINDDEAFDKFFVGFHIFNYLKDYELADKKSRVIYAKIFAYNDMFYSEGVEKSLANIQPKITRLQENWAKFILEQIEKFPRWKRIRKDKITGSVYEDFNAGQYSQNPMFEQHVIEFFSRYKATKTI